MMYYLFLCRFRGRSPEGIDEQGIPCSGIWYCKRFRITAHVCFVIIIHYSIHDDMAFPPTISPVLYKIIANSKRKSGIPLASGEEKVEVQTLKDSHPIVITN